MKQAINVYNFLTESCIVDIDGVGYMIIHGPVTHIYKAKPGKDGEIVKWDYDISIPKDHLEAIRNFVFKKWQVHLDIED